MLYPDTLQAAVLLDGPLASLTPITDGFCQAEEARGPVRFATAPGQPAQDTRLHGSDGTSMAIRLVAGPPDKALLHQALASPVTDMLSGPIAGRVATCTAHLLIDLAQPQDGRNSAGGLAAFLIRLDRLTLACQLACDHAPVAAIHWAQSNQVLSPAAFLALADDLMPGPLHLHPLLFADGTSSNRVGVRSLGARHFIGHELLVEPGSLPFTAHVEAMLGLLRLATSPDGYLIPHGDTFSDGQGDLAYRVSHRPARPGDVPLIVLDPLPCAPGTPSPPPLRRQRR